MLLFLPLPFVVIFYAVLIFLSIFSKHKKFFFILFLLQLLLTYQFLDKLGLGGGFLWLLEQIILLPINLLRAFLSS